ncbi:hypothetical protein [Tsukamurella soli]|uniref:hypothetical protein n=1 Tax=Tsukamurella soli TaxID=644556 RepID=UPI003612A3BC
MELSVILAHDGSPSLRIDAPAAGATYAARLAQASAAVSDLAGRPGVDRRRLLVMGHGDGAAVAAGLAARPSGAPVIHGVALVEPVLAPAATVLSGVPDVVTLATGLPPGSQNLISCSDADIEVHCDDVQSAVDVMAGTHPNFVRLSGMSFALEDDSSKSRDSYTARLPFSATLAASIGTWLTMQ